MNNILAISQVVLKEMVRRKDIYVLFSLLLLLGGGAAVVNSFDDPAIVGYLKEICLLCIWVSSLVISVTSAARQIPAEREQRTVYPLLAKPVSRSQVVIGKFLGCWLATGLALVAFYVLFTALTFTKSSQGFVWATLFQVWWIHWVSLGVVTAMALFGSLVFAAPSSNSTIIFVVVLGILLLGGHLNQLAIGSAQPVGTLLYAIYCAIPHLEWSHNMCDLVIHRQPPIEWWAWGVATLYFVFYGAMLVYAACWKFRRTSLD